MPAAPTLVLDLELDLSLPSSMVLLIEAREAIRLIDQSDISERGAVDYYVVRDILYFYHKDAGRFMAGHVS